jgi:hypothetical protein
LESIRKTRLVLLRSQGALVGYLVMERLSTAPDFAQQVADL